MPRLGPAVIPSLRARDLADTIRFYESLNFKVTGRFEQDGRLVWCEVSRDEARLHFHIYDHPEMPKGPVFSGVLYFRPDDVGALADEWRGKVEFVWGPEVMKYGWREFAFRDPNGYVIAFSEDTKDIPDGTDP